MLQSGSLTSVPTEMRPESGPNISSSSNPSITTSRLAWLDPWKPTIRFCAETEVHVYALSVAAALMLSFYPFLLVAISICKYVLRWPAAVEAVKFGVRGYFPGGLGEFIARNLNPSRLELLSLVLLLFTANGVFEPLEVALNRVWGIAKNRSYLKNQLLSFGLILICGALVFGSFLLSAINRQFLAAMSGGFVPDWLQSLVLQFLFKLAAIPVLILALFLTYWMLPNGRIPALPAFKVAVFVGLAIEALKYGFILLWPFLIDKFEHEYGPFRYSVIFIFFTFIASLILLAGAEWTARQRPDANSGKP